MLPAAFELLMRQLRARDRKNLHGAAMICAETWNIARDQKKHPDGFSAKDFLPELPEDRAQREAEEELMRTAPQTTPQFAAFKEGLSALASLTPEQKAAQGELVKRLTTGKS
jgi:hypothetical protein